MCLSATAKYCSGVLEAYRSRQDRADIWLLHLRRVIALWSSTNNIYYCQRSTGLEHILYREHRTVLSSIGAATSLAGQDLPSLIVQYVMETATMQPPGLDLSPLNLTIA